MIEGPAPRHPSVPRIMGPSRIVGAAGRAVTGISIDEARSSVAMQPIPARITGPISRP